ncbi:hypothetical protein DK389_13475 [Methylobacterium durans]|uniref:Uncharacterized protein n=1 Tax=Methylobacterium durans TaxID=2202825 RepID=A0A2U8W6U5_9HYPH|nr:hypothetical protein DK389_13475 [Methylobacterium durans]
MTGQAGGSGSDGIGERSERGQGPRAGGRWLRLGLAAALGALAGATLFPRKAQGDDGEAPLRRPRPRGGRATP